MGIVMPVRKKSPEGVASGLVFLLFITLAKLVVKHQNSCTLGID